MGQTVQDRKDQHISLANQQYNSASSRDFEALRFVHQSLPQMGVADVDLTAQLVGLKMAVPFYINAMTGGSERTGRINQLLAMVAREYRVPIASGSVSAALKDPSLAASFRILRQENPDGLIFANLGAHHDLENAKRAVDLLEADGLQLHVNAPQELVMPEGDRDFSDWLTNIESIVAELCVPVIVKEVGFGMSRETVVQLASVGVQTVDISGQGGTDFALIENGRRTGSKVDYLNGWGQSTVISLLEAFSLPEEGRPGVLASGGVKNPLDVAKCVALGADAVGLSARFLQPVKDGKSLDTAIADMGNFIDELKIVMTVLGARKVSDLRNKDLVIGAEARDWCLARGIDWQSYANRSHHFQKA